MIEYAVLIDPHRTSFRTGAVLKVERSTLIEGLYIVKEGYCNAINENSIKIISKDEYDITRNIHNKLREHMNNMDEETREYVDELTRII